MVNASPLIVLGKLGHLDLLSSLCAEVVVPEAVVREVCAGPVDDPARRALEADELGRREPVLAVDSVVAAWDLGAGEAGVLTWARGHAGSEAILDDLAARNCARALGIPARMDVGMALVGRRFYYHAWPEVWLAGRWITTDPTWGQLPADVTHLRFLRGGLAHQHELFKVIGQLRTIRLVERTP